MPFSDAEWMVMNALWEESPATAREVLGRVREETGWSYSTVRTLLARLIEKQAVRSRLRGNTLVYQPRVSRRKARRSEVRSLLDRAFDGTFGTLVHHLIAEEKLSSGERKEILRLLRKASGGEAP